MKMFLSFLLLLQQLLLQVVAYDEYADLKLGKLLGSGITASVYETIETPPNAIKVFEGLPFTEYYQEIEILKKLGRFIENTSSPVLSIKMALEPGVDLWTRFKNQQLDSLLEIKYQGLIELQKIHNMGVLHGDIKPDNILTVRNDSGIYVSFVDFGNSKDFNCQPLVNCTAQQNEGFDLELKLFRGWLNTFKAIQEDPPVAGEMINDMRTYYRMTMLKLFKIKQL